MSTCKPRSNIPPPPTSFNACKTPHTMPESLISKPSAAAWGCASTPGWVPFPKKIPRRHPLIDSVGKVDDPCDRPVFVSGSPQPAFRAPLEGYPNDICKNEDDLKVTEGKGGPCEPEGAAVIHVGQGTNKAVQLRIPIVYQDGDAVDTCPKPKPCEGTLQPLLPPSQSWLNNSICTPSNPPYPCSGVIDEIMRELPPPAPPQKCPPLVIHSAKMCPPDMNEMPLTGWENIDVSKTCELYPIADNLPTRFNNPRWFKGYGCERPAHPFYATTTSDYGRFSPNPHTMPIKYFARTGKFTKVMSSGGMYRNRTLNTSNTKSVV